MSESQSDAQVQAQMSWMQENTAFSYTSAFEIRQVMYRIQDIDLPFKRGLRVEQFLAFVAGFLLNAALINIIVYPLLRLLGGGFPWTFHALIWLALPIFLAVQIGRPMPNHKSIAGTTMSFLRYHLDDRWHRRGMPQAKAPTSTELQGNYLRVWTVDPQYKGIESPHDLPATEFVKYSNIDLPDHKVVLPHTVVEREGILESDEEFLERLFASSDITTIQEYNAVKDEEDIAPRFVEKKPEDETL